MKSVAAEIEGGSGSGSGLDLVQHFLLLRSTMETRTELLGQTTELESELTDELVLSRKVEVRVQLKVTPPEPGPLL